MRRGGRPGKRPAIEGVRELTLEEVQNGVHGRAPSVKRFRDSHHMLARLFAIGMRPGAVAERVGYSIARVSTISGDPAFQELVESYRASVDEKWKESVDEYFDLAISNRIISARLINDKLTEAEPDDISMRELVMVHSDMADRTGYPKRTVAVNVNVDFAAQLDRAIKRSSQSVQPHLPGPGPITIEGETAAEVVGPSDPQPPGRSEAGDGGMREVEAEVFRPSGLPRTKPPEMIDVTPKLERRA